MSLGLIAPPAKDSVEWPLPNEITHREIPASPRVAIDRMLELDRRAPAEDASLGSADRLAAFFQGFGDAAAFLDPASGYLSELDRLREAAMQEVELERTVVGSSVAVTTGLSVGYVAWLVRGGVLLSTALSSLPAWQFIDPLPVLARTREDGDDGRDDSLESIIKEQSARAANKTSGTAEAGDVFGAPENSNRSL